MAKTAFLTTRRNALLLLAALLGGCSSTAEREPEAIPQWPQADPRYVWEVSLRSNRDVNRDADDSAFKRMLAGEEPAIGFNKPFAVAAQGGRIYVSDTTLRRIHAFDVVRKRYFQFGFRFEGTLGKPLGLALDQSGRVYVADGTRKLVVVFDGFGLFQKTIGDPDELVRPTSVAVNRDGSRIYIVDTGGVASNQHRILAYDNNGQKLYELGPRGSEPGQFNLPVDAAVDANGTLYVLDAGNFRVQAFDAEGRFLRSWGQVGRGLGQFARPRGIAVDNAGNIYVVDSFFGNVQIFDSEGRLLLPLGSISKTDLPGRYALASDTSVDETGRVYILDQLFQKLDVIRPVRE